jgi:2-polyprenyl-3-methyl-5-hydroxy-6-metoxy-1,4-benzoquinol methylase
MISVSDGRTWLTMISGGLKSSSSRKRYDCLDKSRYGLYSEALKAALNKKDLSEGSKSPSSGKRYDYLDKSRYGVHATALKAVVGRINILDIGCATGRLTRELIKRGHKVVGLEIDEAAAMNARMNGCVVVVGDTEKFAQLDFENESFDAVLCLDVLEHTRDPKKVLESIKPVIKSDGIVVCSLPNVANIRIRIELARGRWEYRDIGILDRTHLRFFSVSSARALIESAGYRIVHEEYTPWVPFMDNTRSGLAKKIVEAFPGLFAVQTIIIATK